MNKKTLVYVDAENISVQKFDEFVAIMNSKCDYHETTVIGKFYGDHRVLGNILIRCMQEGYEYIDTALLCSTKKNVTDMKIVVDCISDAVSLHSQSDLKIYVVSSDHDFMPLAYKLRGLHCDIELPFLDDSIAIKTCSDLSKYLAENRFEVYVKNYILESPFDVIRDFTKGEFSDDIIEAFVKKRMRKIANSISDLYGIEIANKILAIDIKVFKYKVLQETIDNQKKENIELLNIYATKMYGICLPSAMSKNVLKGVDKNG